ncbi:MAG: DNA-O6-methylguanine--protein-cysteine S-methyltransferase [Pseudomonas sp.]|jgi:AraC family transcriptional regulator of adaptative response/methylated-DNA-[protein]-cysteine methyltransferase|uniref:methylated-DNA--[protein]-cysteine S-methyltransferase n=1 Tax=Pseudomonas sp. TaxID=306 RepID=UPI0026049733|nr:methylated-DNA--[protein]-cysteine S-methyltransferase [Pseudomonas sp.]MDB6050020.1 DNA-O6-methylguanine--protein-cysteine S-methyltransferase [Pseudomonas sp.]
MNIFTTPNVKLNFREPGKPVPGDIHYAIGESTHGVLLAARCDDGVCAIFVGDHADRLRNEIIAAFPKNPVVEEYTGWQRELAQVVAVMEGTSCDLMNVTVGGTPFQQKVWQALCAIPYGSTRSYRQIAEQLGTPGSVRAVAGACAANVLAFAIPCHRVVSADGSISGYRWGSERKREILKQEGRL